MRSLVPPLCAAAILGLTAGVGIAEAAAEIRDAAGAYGLLCASCHGERRYGGYAPPLIPETLRRRSDADLRRALLEGLPATQMPGFSRELDGDLADGLVALLRRDVGAIRWNATDIAASRSLEPAGGAPKTLPPDRANLILVVERGTGSISVLDGGRMKEADRFEVGRVHGGLKFDRDHTRVVAATRDGTVVDYDLVGGRVRTRVKVGVNTRNVALSPDGASVAVANQLPQNLVLLDGDLRPRAIFPLAGQPSGVYPAPGRRGFLLTLRDVALLYAIDDGSLRLRAVELPEPFEDFVLIPGTVRLLASSRGGRRIVLYDLARERELHALETEGLPHLFSACFFERGGARLAALNHIGVPRLTVLDVDTLQVVSEIPLHGAGYFARTHVGTPFVWVDTNTEEIQLIEKRSLQVMERSLIPAPGKKAMHVEFTADGARALVSVWDPEGAVVVYDSRSLEEIARLPYSMPVGKYNPFNKTRSEW